MTGGRTGNEGRWEAAVGLSISTVGSFKREMKSRTRARRPRRPWRIVCQLSLSWSNLGGHAGAFFALAGFCVFAFFFFARGGPSSA